MLPIARFYEDERKNHIKGAFKETLPKHISITLQVQYLHAYLLFELAVECLGAALRSGMGREHALLRLVVRTPIAIMHRFLLAVNRLIQLGRTSTCHSSLV